MKKKIEATPTKKGLGTSFLFNIIPRPRPFRMEVPPGERRLPLGLMLARFQIWPQSSRFLLLGKLIITSGDDIGYQFNNHFLLLLALIDEVTRDDEFIIILLSNTLIANID